MQPDDALLGLAALAQPSRLAIIRLLVQHAPDGLSAGVIAERLGPAPATLSFHLKELHRARLVEQRQQGRFLYYSAGVATMNAGRRARRRFEAKGDPGRLFLAWPRQLES